MNADAGIGSALYGVLQGDAVSLCISLTDCTLEIPQAEQSFYNRFARVDASRRGILEGRFAPTKNFLSHKDELFPRAETRRRRGFLRAYPPL